MKKKISGWKFQNGKEINTGIVTGKHKPNEVDDFYLEIIDQDNVTRLYLRPDEMILISKVINDTLLERIIGFEVNPGRLTKEDYKLKQFHPEK